MSLTKGGQVVVYSYFYRRPFKSDVFQWMKRRWLNAETCFKTIRRENFMFLSFFRFNTYFEIYLGSSSNE